jgi:CubicO group peptidase (beta-lactamase class C family)
MLQLWEAGMVDLDGNINSYMPFNVVNPNHPDSSMTIRSLLAHTSSLNDNWSVMYSTNVPGDTPILLEDYGQSYFLPGGSYYDGAVNFNTWMPETRWE